MRLVLSALLLLLFFAARPAVLAQETDGAAARPGQRNPSLTLTFGLAEPLSREAFTDFWLRGPVGSVSFTVDVRRSVALGVGVDVSVYFFNQTAFLEKYPGVPIHQTTIGIIDLYLMSKVMFRPGMVISPYLTATLGASHSTGASYKIEEPLPRRIYYDLPRSTRLSLGLALGTDIVVSRWFALVVEAKLSYIHNDPSIGLLAFLRGGFRFRM
jgi:hypothetical protein